MQDQPIFVDQLRIRVMKQPHRIVRLYGLFVSRVSDCVMHDLPYGAEFALQPTTLAGGERVWGWVVLAMLLLST